MNWRTSASWPTSSRSSSPEGHGSVVGINYLEKIQFPTLPSLYGAMLAKVDVHPDGGGHPGRDPRGARCASSPPAGVDPLDVLEAGGEKFELHFDPPRSSAGRGPVGAAEIPRPKFFPIVSAATLAKALLRKSPGGIDGFVVEGPTAGGHNAPPRGQLHLSERGEPVYGERDVVDLEQMKSNSGSVLAGRRVRDP